MENVTLRAQPASSSYLILNSKSPPIFWRLPWGPRIRTVTAPGYAGSWLSVAAWRVDRVCTPPELISSGDGIPR